jgi:hypothetical protein
MKKWLQIVVAGLLPLLMAATVSATITGGSVDGGTAYTFGGTFVPLSTPLQNPFGDPNSVGADNYQSMNLFGFNENQNIKLTNDLMLEDGSHLDSGKLVASHYIFFDPAAIPPEYETILGTVDFDADVLAIITVKEYLLASDFLQNTGIHYLKLFLIPQHHHQVTTSGY